MSCWASLSLFYSSSSLMFLFLCSLSDSSNGCWNARLHRHFRPQSSIRSAAVWIRTSSTRVRVHPCHHDARQPSSKQPLHESQQVGNLWSPMLEKVSCLNTSTGWCWKKNLKFCFLYLWYLMPSCVHNIGIKMCFLGLSWKKYFYWVFLLNFY